MTFKRIGEGQRGTEKEREEQRGRERARVKVSEREGERNIDWLSACTPPNGNQICNLVM